MSDIPWSGVEEFDLTPENDSEWVCLQVARNKEWVVAAILSSLGLPYFVPCFKRRGAPSSRQIAKPAPLFPGYLFCRVESERLTSIRHVAGVIQIHRQDQGSLLEELRELSRLIKSGDTLAATFRAGDEVMVNQGSLAGIQGTVTASRVQDGSGRLVVSVKLLERSIAVQIDPDWATLKTRAETVIEEILSPVTTFLDTELLRYLAKHPDRLYQVDPRKFEELVAELLRDMGYDVRLTPATVDGGRDVLAVFKIPAGEILTIVECKRFAADRHIGPDLVQRLLWVADRYDNASRAMLATTSFFSPKARDLERQFRWRLGLKDFAALEDWLGKYGQWQHESKAGLWTPQFEPDSK